MSTESEKKGIEASFKSMDTEEFLDIYFNRPIGYAWALLFKKLKVHPNVVTIFSIILGIGAGVMFYYPDMKHTLIGILLLMWANHYDSKFGLEKINGIAKGIPFSVEELKIQSDKAAEALNVPIYGGDCVVSADGTLRIIDFNDWPSFARCREEAGGKIAECIYNRAKKQMKQ